MAFGYCGWRPADFWESTWFELACAIRGVRDYGTVSLIAKMFSGGGDTKGKPGAPWTEAEALYLAGELEARREEYENPSNIIQLRRALKQSRRVANG